MTRRRMARVSSTKPSRVEAFQIHGSTIASKSAPSSGSPAAARALSSAWNSHEWAQRV